MLQRDSLGHDLDCVEGRLQTGLPLDGLPDRSSHVGDKSWLKMALFTTDLQLPSS